jgi:hypothetical protein
MARKDGCQNHPHLQHSADQVRKMTARHIMQDVKGDIQYMLIVHNPECVDMAWTLNEKSDLAI